MHHRTDHPGPLLAWGFPRLHGIAKSHAWRRRHVVARNATAGDDANAMTEPGRDPDASRLDTDETVEALTVPDAAERLGLSIDAVRMRLRRGTLQSTDIDGKKHVLVARSVSDETRRDTDATPTAQPSADATMVEQLRSEVAYLRQTLDAEIEARRRADHLVAGLIDERRELATRLAAVTAGDGEHETEHRRVADETPTIGDMPQERAAATLRGDQPAQAPDSPLDRLRRALGRVGR